eukprot:TRINITY_DN20829_c1_g1_i2.p1 TRINITY_DN20829_c1_g1~~TRINITY_DN20829_c1_g1_i2.p1  ORF type:complete len:1078 (-),score=204.38 TRINITY_DN20829_c1_g1_i2:276-3509(-)
MQCPGFSSIQGSCHLQCGGGQPGGNSADDELRSNCGAAPNGNDETPVIARDLKVASAVAATVGGGFGGFEDKEEKAGGKGGSINTPQQVSIREKKLDEDKIIEAADKPSLLGNPAERALRHVEKAVDEESEKTVSNQRSERSSDNEDQQVQLLSMKLKQNLQGVFAGTVTEKGKGHSTRQTIDPADVVLLEEQWNPQRLSELGIFTSPDTTKAVPAERGPSRKAGASFVGEAIALTLQEEAQITRRSIMAIVFVSVLAVTCFVVLGYLSLQHDAPECPERRAAGVGSCEACGGGTTIAPLFGEYERSWPKPLRAVLYFLGLGWGFLGIGIVCDQFMDAIDAITKATTVVLVEVHPGTREKLKLAVWNPTIANLTLMALGSSAPEILLSVIEVCSQDFFAGDLGPSTIVGSAAFNLFIIMAVCISALPDGEIRTIEYTDVFAVTATTSVLAYIWLLVILQISSPDVVEVWEAVATLLGFPTLLVVAYCADRGYLRHFLCSCRRRSEADHSEALVDKESKKLVEKYGESMPSESVMTLMRNLKATLGPSLSTRPATRRLLNLTTTRFGFRSDLIIGFQNRQVTVNENCGKCVMRIVTTRAVPSELTIQYCTVEGTATRERFEHRKGAVKIPKEQREAVLEVDIVNDRLCQLDEHFYVQILDAYYSEGQDVAEGAPEPLLGEAWQCTVTIQDDDAPGTLAFTLREAFVAPSTQATIGVYRSNSSGYTTCRWRTVEGNGRTNVDFQDDSGMLEFEDGETHATISIQTFYGQADNEEAERRFQVQIYEAYADTDCNYKKSASEAFDTLTVVIVHEDHENKPVCCHSEEGADWPEDWCEDAKASIYCLGSSSEQLNASLADWLMHLACLPFKLLFIVVPPTSLWNGWPRFCVALTLIGVLTAFIGDLASMMGCCIGLPDSVTAITLVALGTSLPDTMASRVAAVKDPTADNCVGNVMGSNSVNVFLGLGISWSIAAIYWGAVGPTEDWKARVHQGQRFEDFILPRYPQGGFVVPAGSLVFSVCIFTACALVCLAVLLLRRCLHGGELGGPKKAQFRDSTVLCSLWVLYVLLTINNSMQAEVDS